MAPSGIYLATRSDQAEEEMKKRKTLGQISYEAYRGDSEWCSWGALDKSAQRIHQRSARAVELEVLKRIRKKYPMIEWP
jgi:hypothetical protein